MFSIKKLCLASIAALLFLSSCTSVKEYQKMYVNDNEMKLAARKSQKFEQAFQLYREGASGANGGKTGGGCGCN
jgi:protein involved in sex pheromone biosynthesis